MITGHRFNMHAHGDSLLFHPNSAGHHIFDLNLALIIVSTILISLRIIVRKFVVKAMGWDDLIAIVAWVGRPAFPGDPWSETDTKTAGTLRDAVGSRNGHYQLRHRGSDGRCASTDDAPVPQGRQISTLTRVSGLTTRNRGFPSWSSSTSSRLERYDCRSWHSCRA